MEQGYIRVFRKILKNPIMQDAEVCRFWLWCLCRATHQRRQIIDNGIIVDIEPGQFICGRKSAAEALNTTERKVRTCLKTLAKLRQIDVKTTSRFSIITVCNWSKYQYDEVAGRPTDDQQTTKRRPTGDHIQEQNKNKEQKKEQHCPVSPDEAAEVDSIIFSLNEKAGTAYHLNGQKTRALIQTRLKEGHTVADFQTVIGKKVQSWGHDAKMCKFLRPETLFGPKFEGYLNEVAPLAGPGPERIDPTKPMKAGDTGAILRAMQERRIKNESRHSDNRIGDGNTFPLGLALQREPTDT